MSDHLFGLQFRLRKIDQNGDPLVKINQFVDWELFRPDLEAAREAVRAREPKSNAGRPSTDSILLFKMLVLQSLFNLSDDALEQQSLDRLSFQRFLGLSLGDPVPDAKTLWAFREALKPNDLAKRLFLRFDAFLRANGFEAQQGQIVDATLVRVRVRRDTPEVNAQVKRGEGDRVEGWGKNARPQKDTDARWTVKGGKSHIGYKDHAGADVKHKLLRAYDITPASVHDDNRYEPLITANTSPEEYADSAYRSAERMAGRAAAGKVAHIQERGRRGHPLTEAQRAANRERSRIRSRIEHIFGAMRQRAGDLILRTVGLARARVKLGLRNLAYNLERYAWLRLAGRGDLVS